MVLSRKTKQNNTDILHHRISCKKNKKKLAKHPQYSVEATRLSSYSKWPHTCPQNPRILCDAGFYYAGFGDCVRCFYCGGGLRNWEDGDIPWIEHARWYHNCEYLKQRKGDLFIEMHRQKNQEDTSTPLQPPSHSQTANTRQSCEQAKGKEMEMEIQKSSKEENDDIAVASVLEMGYSKATVNSAVEVLRNQGKSKFSAMDIMAIILDEEERQTSVPSATTKPAANGTVGAVSSEQHKTSIVSTDSRSLLKENKTLKDQMLCKICLDKDASMVYLPCGHMVTCQDCAPTIQKCCICRKLIQATVKAYL